MSRNESRLAGLLGVVLGIWAITSGFEQWIVAPLRQRQLEVEELETEVSRLEALRERRLADGQLSAQAANQTVSADPSVAVTRLQRWLTELSADLELGDVVITPHASHELTPRAKSVAVTMSINGEPEQLFDLLSTLNANDRLVRLRRVQLEQAPAMAGPGNELHLHVELEALCLNHPESSSSDPLTAKLVRTVSRQFDSLHQAMASLQTQAAIPLPERFTPLESEKPAPQTEQRPRSLKLIAAVSVDGVSEAWILDSLDERPHYVREGDQLELPSIDDEFRVVKISGDQITLALGETTREMQVGKDWQLLAGSPVEEDLAAPSSVRPGDDESPRINGSRRPR